ncbi:sucrose-6-phosphate hydrolase [Paenalkalicoccus suaedae]|uniref:Sucrose-6-phosphate hydrolase n=1 Tax=Paenalkalicoccus suaedae TaxID=2592382 RepID=A0A859FKE5_9BACI|nr:sucrose-6-phosphate hydrolase [Paenalkalicoccus suaedae]
MTDKERELHELAYAEVKKHKETVDADPYRQAFHIMPPVGLVNDPNGFVQWNGTYHMFYQWNPFAPNHSHKFWGHVTSDDLVNWKEQPIAIAPSDWFDKNGCYSGSGIDVDGKLTLMYTGNVKDEDGNRESYQCLAVSEDGVHFEKLGPVVDQLPEGYTAHFRDPKVWKENGRYYFVIGAQTEDLTGRVLLYSSDDMKNWELHGPIAGSNVGTLREFGYMWECPDVFRLDGTDVLVVSPQGLEAEGLRFHNVYQAGYFLGNLDLDKASFEHGEFDELDRGFEFYAPQTTVDESGRRILVGWMGVPDQEEEYQPTVEKGWIHCLTVPRVLTVEDGLLKQRPVAELSKLRGEATHAVVSLQDEMQELVPSKARAQELLLTDLEQAEWEIDVFGAATISYDKATNLLSFERPNGKTGDAERRQVKVDRLSELRVFIDRSSLELFVNDGEYVLTGRIFPGESESGLRVRGESVNEFAVTAWDFE